MAYISLYRKWRPQNFSDIAGQQNVVKTLTNAIKMDRIAHAYLFCGPRGTGKTSTAKILAKALNCKQGPTIKPCDECEPCTKIKNNNSIDVIEIDAASNRGIDEIRDLREKVKFSPTEGNYKVYIIDEVHMLTTEAFNALLKTLEEPPSYVIFILATTEPHKLLPTILSRCQRFDFTRLLLEDIKDRLNYICEQEDITVDSNALSTIARSADGGMRDAISILDQTISFSGYEIQLEDVESVLGMVSDDILFDLVMTIINQKMESALKIVNNVINQGKNIEQFVSDLIYHLRSLLLIKECDSINDLVDITVDTKQRLINQAEKLTISQLLNGIEILSEIEYDLKQTTKPKIIFELGIIKLLNLENDNSLKTIVDRLNRLEEIIEQGNININCKDESEKQKVKKQANSQNKSLKKENKVKINAPVDINLNQVKNQWNTILNFLKEKKKMRLQALLKDATPIKIENNKLTISFKHKFHKESVENQKEEVSKILKKFLGVSLQVNCIFSRKNKDSTQGLQAKKKEVLEHPLVKEAIELFDGEVIKIKNLD